jgi:hypothetical protein
MALYLPPLVVVVYIRPPSTRGWNGNGGVIDNGGLIAMAGHYFLRCQADRLVGLYLLPDL